MIGQVGADCFDPVEKEFWGWLYEAHFSLDCAG